MPGVRGGSLLPRHKVVQRVKRGHVHRRRLVFGEALLPQGIGPSGGIGRPRRLPPLERPIVGQLAVPEGRLVMRHRVAAPKEVVARANLGKGFNCQLVVVDLYTVQIRTQRAAQVSIQHELRISHAEKPIRKPRRMQNEVRAEMHGSQH